jgi:hypothetical protein
VTSPTSLTLAECRKRGWPAYVTEKWIPKTNIRKDAFGFGDVLVLDGEPGSSLVQTTDTDNMGARVRKILGIPEALEWLRAGNRIRVWGWALRGPAGKRKLWTLKERNVVESDFEQP